MKILARSLAAFLIASAAMATPASAEQMVRASCSEGGEIVYKERFPARDSQKHRLDIASKFPKAFCIFLDAPDGREPEPAAASGTNAYFSTESVDDSLAAALAAISSGAATPGTAYPDSFARSMNRDMAEMLGAPPRTLNLAIGIYRNMSTQDVLAHWRYIQSESSVLSGMQPTINVVDGISVLSVEEVPDTLAAQLCTEASRTGSGCLAVY